MTRILTIIALLFATPAWAASLEVSGLSLSESLNCENGLIVQKAYGDNLTECLVLIVEQNKTVWTPNSITKIHSDEDFAKIKEFTAPYFEKKKKVEQQKKADTRKKTLAGYRAECAEYGYASGSKELADCVKDLDIAAKQNEVLGQMKERVERAEQEAARAKREAAAASDAAAAAGVAAEQAEKEASRASTQAIISNTIANQAKRDANTIPYGKDCPWLSGCKK
jgi:hypothetical protein